MNRYKILDKIRKTDIVGDANYYSILVADPNINAVAVELQRENLIKQLIKLRENNFYRDFLEGVSDEEINVNPYEVLKKFPISDKKFLQNNKDRIFNPKYGYENNYTGGSTGMPFHHFVDKRLISKTAGFTMFCWTYFGGFNFSDETIVVGGTSIGDRHSIKKRLLHFLQRRYFISGGEITEANARLLASKVNSSKKPVMLYGYPSSLCQYIDIIDKLDININIEKIKSVLTTSETLTADRRKILERHFQKPIVNLYGARDGGISAAEIGDGEFIYNGIDCYVENINIDGINELVLTHLHSDAFPFVRYRIGDIATVRKREDGYPFILTDLTGRTRDLIVLPDERKIHGSKINKIFTHYNVGEYQVYQKKDGSCNVYIIPNGKISIEAIKNEINGLLGSDVDVNIIITEEIKRSKNNKFRNIISEIS